MAKNGIFLRDLWTFTSSLGFFSASFWAPVGPAKQPVGPPPDPPPSQHFYSSQQLFPAGWLPWGFLGNSTTREHHHKLPLSFIFPDFLSSEVDPIRADLLFSTNFFLESVEMNIWKRSRLLRFWPKVF